MSLLYSRMIGNEEQEVRILKGYLKKNKMRYIIKNYK